MCVLLSWDEERRRFVERLQVLGIPVRVLVVTEAGQAKAVDASVRASRQPVHVLETGRIEESLERAIQEFAM